MYVPQDRRRGGVTSIIYYSFQHRISKCLSKDLITATNVKVSDAKNFTFISLPPPSPSNLGQGLGNWKHVLQMSSSVFWQYDNSDKCWQDHVKYILLDLELDHLSNLYRLTSPRIASKVEISNNCWDRLWLLEVNYLGHVRRKNMKRLISLDPPSPARESNVRNIIINNLHQLWPVRHVLILETDLLFVMITLVCAGLRCEVRGPWASLLLRHCVICMADGFYLVSWRIVL